LTVLFRRRQKKIDGGVTESTLTTSGCVLNNVDTPCTTSHPRRLERNPPKYLTSCQV